MKILAIVHSYAADRELGSYTEGQLKGFAKRGYDVDVILANHLVTNLNANSLRESVDEKRLASYANNGGYAFVYNTNRAGIGKRFAEALQIPLVTWMVDRIPFYHHGGDHRDVFSERDKIISASRSGLRLFQSMYPSLRDNCHFLPFATDPEDFRERSEKKYYNISFIGSFFSSQKLERIISKNLDSNEVLLELKYFIDHVIKGYELDVREFDKNEKIQKILYENEIDIIKLKGQVANAKSMNERIKYLDAVADLGLTLFGTKNWTNATAFSLPVVNAFDPRFIKSRSDIAEVYNRSMVSLNIPHHQSDGGMPYRIFDILASDSLLVEKFHKAADLFHVFGEDLPVPTYKDERELRKIAEHFLSADDERAQIIAHCNACILKGHTFSDRAAAVMEIAGYEPLDGEGTVTHLGEPELHAAGVLTQGAFKRAVKAALPKQMQRRSLGSLDSAIRFMATHGRPLDPMLRVLDAGFKRTWVYPHLVDFLLRKLDPKTIDLLKLRVDEVRSEE